MVAFRLGATAIISQALFSCRKYYARLLTMAKDEDPFIVTPLPRLPAERNNEDEAAQQAQKEQICDLIDKKSNDDIRDNEKALALLEQCYEERGIQLQGNSGSLKIDKRLYPLRNDPRFQELVAKFMGQTK